MSLDQLNSDSSSLMLGVNLFKNQGCIGSQAIAQISCTLIADVAVVESTAASVFTGLVILMYPLTSKLFKYSIEWLSSSFFCVAWSVGDFFFNPFTQVLVADEPSARRIVNNGNLMHIPPNAWI